MKKNNYFYFLIVLLLISSNLISAQNCQVTNSFLTGDYFLTQTTPASNSPYNVLSFKNQIVNISLGNSSEKRLFSAVWVEGLGIGQNAMDVSFSLDCTNGSDIIVDNDLDTFLTCAAGDPNIGSITLGPATATGTFNVNNDGTFTLILAEFVDDGGCGVPNPVVTEFSLTKCTPKPDNISFTNPTPNSVDLNWIDVANTANTSNTYTIEYGVEGFDLGTGQVINNVSSSSITVNNLQTDVIYDFYIYTSCSGILNTSGPFPYGNFNNADFVLDANGVTCLCPNANFGDTGTLTINGQQKTFTKRTRTQLVALIANDVDDPQVALTCTSGINDMKNLFENRIFFNQNLQHWDVSNVTDMKRMFNGASSFNQTLNMWDVSNVIDMSFMFSGAGSFNQLIGSWNVSNVIDMEFMFGGTISFNKFIGNWDVSSVTDMQLMFATATSFNQPINNWDVSNVTSMDNMFSSATSFNQDISDWCVEQITTQPTGFAAGSALQASFFPDWGATCTFSIAENKLENFKVYPNPAENKLNLSWSATNSSDEMSIQVYSLNGKRVLSQSYNENPSELNVSQLASGVYLLKVNSGDQSAVRRIVKK